MDGLRSLPDLERKIALRRLCLTDLFFLLAFVLRRRDVQRAMLIPRRADFIMARCREVQANPDGFLDLWAREHYKDLANDTPILTANRGWVTHGDLMVGDEVFSPYGYPVKVLALTEKYTDSKCYRLTFSNGSSIVAGSGHRWNIRKKSRKRIPEGREVKWHILEVTTEEMNIGDDIGVLKYPLLYPTHALPIAPYVLGAWLGDGESSCGRLCGNDDEIFDYIKNLGYKLSATHCPQRSPFRTCTIYELSKELRALNLIKNKHIPPQFMHGSVEQREELLRGLMDTDGHCNDRGTATFVNVNERLAKDVYALASSLALRPRIRHYKNSGNGYWQVSMQAHQDRNPFRIRRKASRAIPASKHRDACTLVKKEMIKSVGTRCIQVKDGEYVAGYDFLPTKNSTIITFAKTIQDVLINPEITVGIFSHTRPNAKKFLSQIAHEFQTNDLLKWIFDDILYESPGRDAPRWSLDEGIIVKRIGNPKEATVSAYGLVDGMPTGAHFSHRIYDDVVVPGSVTTPEQIKKTTEAWEMSDNLGSEGGVERYIGTRYTLFDTYSVMIQRGINVRKYTATHSGRLDGKPVLFSDKYWAHKLKTQSRKTLAAQMMQNPMADTDATFLTPWLRSYDVRPRVMNVVILCDPSRGKHKKSDNTAMIVIGLAAANKRYLLDGYCHRMSLSQRWTCLRDLYYKWSKEPGVQTVDIGYERYGAQSDDEYFQLQILLEKLTNFPVIQELNWTLEGTAGLQGKTARVERLEPDFRNSRFFLPLTVWRNGMPYTWKVDDDQDSNTYQTIMWQEFIGSTKNQIRALEGGAGDLICRSIRRKDNEGQVYDLTEKFIEEYISFPFGGHDDIIDATSRIYDMDVLPPMAISQAKTDPNVYIDS